MTRFLLGGFFLLWMILPACADETALVALMHRLGEVRSSTAHFTETSTLAILDAPVVSTGTLIYRAPGHVERITTTPKPENMIVDGDDITLTRDGTTRTIGLSYIPGIGALVEGVRGTLSGDLPGLRKHYTVTMQGDAAHWVLLLQPNESDVQQKIQYIRITGDGSALRDIETLQADGDKTDMAIAQAGP